MIEKRNPDVKWDPNEPWDEDLNKLHDILMDMLDHQDSVTGEELWFLFTGKGDYRNGYFVYTIKEFFTTLDMIQIEEPEPNEFIFRMSET